MLAFSAMAAAIWDLESAFAIVQLVFSCWFCLCSSVLRLGRIKTVHCDAARRKTLKNQRILRIWPRSPVTFQREVLPLRKDAPPRVREMEHLPADPAATETNDRTNHLQPFRQGFLNLGEPGTGAQ